MELKGVIKRIGERENFGKIDKIELVVTTREQYPQHILVEFINQKIELLDNCRVRDEVSVQINIRGREFTNKQGVVKYFNSIQGWSIAKIDSFDSLD